MIRMKMHLGKTHQHAAKTENAKITQRENKTVKQKVQQR